MKYRFEPQVGKEIVLYVDTVGHRGTAGPVRLYVRLDGFMVLRGKEEWEVEVGPGRTESHQLMLRAVERAPRLTVVTHHVERAVELASDELRFWVDEDGFVVECQPEDEACK